MRIFKVRFSRSIFLCATLELFLESVPALSCFRLMKILIIPNVLWFATAAVTTVIRSKSNTWIRWSILYNDPASIISRSAPLIIGCREFDEHQMSLVIETVGIENLTQIWCFSTSKIRMQNMPAPEGRFECSNDRRSSSPTVVDKWCGRWMVWSMGCRCSGRQ